MNAFLLLQALRDYLQPRLAELPLAIHGRDAKGCPMPQDDGKESMRPCAVYLGSMPPTSQEAISAAPFIVLQPLEGHDTGDHFENARVAIRLCIVAEDDEAAENDLLNLLSQIRLWLLELPGGALGKFRLLPYGEDNTRLPWERPDEQIRPFLQAHIFTEWQTHGAVMRPATGMDDYG